MRFVVASVVVVVLAVVVLAVVANLPAAAPPRPDVPDLPTTLENIDRHYRDLFAPLESEYVARKSRGLEQDREYLELREEYRQAMRDAYLTAGQAVPMHIRDWDNYTPQRIESAIRQRPYADKGTPRQMTAEQRRKRAAEKR